MSDRCAKPTTGRGILLVGDLHRTANNEKIKEDSLKRTLGSHYPPRYLLCLGDWGVIWSDTPASLAEEERLIHWYDQHPFETIVVLGNHEGYDRIERLPIVERFGGPVYRVADSISILQNGNLYTIDGKTFFAFGGGDSVDKNRRLPGESWWSQEIPTQEQLERGIQTLCAAGGVVDYVVSHTCPRNVIEHMEDKDLLVHRLKALDPTVEMLTALGGNFGITEGGISGTFTWTSGGGGFGACGRINGFWYDLLPDQLAHLT